MIRNDIWMALGYMRRARKVLIVTSELVKIGFGLGIGRMNIYPFLKFGSPVRLD